MKKIAFRIYRYCSKLGDKRNSKIMIADYRGTLRSFAKKMGFTDMSREIINAGGNKCFSRTLKNGTIECLSCEFIK